VQHIEFFHRYHFEQRYHRRKARKSLAQFIDFFWETDFDALYKEHPRGFSDALFPNVGYTYLINLGTPFVMQLGTSSHEMKSDGFLPRHTTLVCHHSEGNRIFGIKFRVSPVIFEKKINFSEYREYIFPLAYLIDRSIVEAVKKAGNFEKRVQLLSDHYESVVRKHAGSIPQVDVVTSILQDSSEKKIFNESIESLSARHGISSRTLQRYFEATTSISGKQALQILRIRAAIECLTSGDEFDCTDFGYYDISHFQKHLKKFLAEGNLQLPKLGLLRTGN